LLLIALKRTDYLARPEKSGLLLIALKRTDYLARSEKNELLLVALKRTDYLARSEKSGLNILQQMLKMTTVHPDTQALMRFSKFS